MTVFKAALKEADFQRKEHIRKQGTTVSMTTKMLFLL